MEPNDLPKPASAPEANPLVTSRTLEAPKHEIDLHIEKLVGSPRGMSNAEILKIQLDALQRYLNLAVVHHLDRMIIIHGLGKGTLREEVHAVLKRTPEVARFKNEWSGKYGFGATEVFFRR
jgi:dsDNA-specific endonuclease/ATPase MutS2